MIKKIALIFACFSSLLFIQAVPAFASPQSDVCSGARDLKIDGTSGCPAADAENSTANNIITKIINLLSIVVGIIAVIMIVVAGFRYITSGGNEQSVAAAKKTLIFAIIGLVIVALAQVIARFVLGKTTSA